MSVREEFMSYLVSKLAQFCQDLFGRLVQFALRSEKPPI
jgi:hypothetical protein